MSQRKATPKAPPRWFQRLAAGDPKVRQVVIIIPPHGARNRETRDMEQLWDFVSSRARQNSI